MTTKIGRLVTYFEILLTIKLFYALITWSCKVFLKDQHSETKKAIQNSVILLKVYSSLQIASNFLMIEVLYR